LRAPRSGNDPGCVKTCTSRECAELFSLFSSFDGDCQSGSFLIQRNRDKLSTRKFDVGVFTQPRPTAVIASWLRGAMNAARSRTPAAVGPAMTGPVLLFSCAKIPSRSGSRSGAVSWVGCKHRRASWALEFATKIVWYYLHERVWAAAPWGRR
jgi:hypothetical protein